MLMGRNLGADGREKLKAAVLEFVTAAAKHGHVLPALDQIGRMLQVSHNTIKYALDQHEAAGTIRQRVKFVPGAGLTRVVTIVATGQKTAERKPPIHIGQAAKRYATYDQQVREEREKRDKALYGPILADVRWLCHRGWVITKEATGFKCGNAIVTAADIVAKAARERRLAGVAQ
jgi:DNA-binding transcriptional MocR family regulator